MDCQCGILESAFTCACFIAESCRLKPNLLRLDNLNFKVVYLPILQDVRVFLIKCLSENFALLRDSFRKSHSFAKALRTL